MSKNVKKIAFGFLWFVAIWFGSLMIGGMISGSIAGGKAGAETKSPADAYKKGQEIGQKAGEEFGRKYGLVLLFGAFIIASAGTISGVLPGTDNKKTIQPVDNSKKSSPYIDQHKPITLVGMLDSPFVRRTAISLRCLNIPFEHKSVSVFSTFAEFQKINPVVKAPTLVFDNGEVLMDSTLILEFAESIANGRSLLPQDINLRIHVLRTISYSLIACEKAAQFIYEKNLRPEEKQHEPWLDRVKGQLLASCNALELEIAKEPVPNTTITSSQALITTAVTWQFIQSMLGDIVDANNFPMLQKLSQAAELLPEFAAFPPDGPGVAISV